METSQNKSFVSTVYKYILLSISSMYIMLVMATCLVLTVNGYTFQKPVRPSIVPFQTASHVPHRNIGGYGGQQHLASGGAPYLASGTRHHQILKKPIGLPSSVRSYLFTPSHIASLSSVSKASVTNNYQIPQQKKPQGASSFQPSRPYSSQINAVTQRAPSKQHDSWKVITSQAYAVGPVVSSIRAETSHQIKNPSPNRWIPSYGGPQNPAQQSGWLSATGGYKQQQFSHQPTGHGSNITNKKEKESTNENVGPNHESPLQTAHSTTPRPIIQDTKTNPNRKNPGDVPSVIPQTISQSNALPAANNYHRNPTVSQVPSKSNALVPASEAHNYQIPKVSVSNTLSQSESSTPSSAAVNSYQEFKTTSTPSREEGKYSNLSDATNTYQIPISSTALPLISATRTPSPQSITTEHYSQVKVTTETPNIVPQQKKKESSFVENKEAHNNPTSSEPTSITTDLGGDGKQSSYTKEPVELHDWQAKASSESINGYQNVKNDVATTTKGPSYPTHESIEVPSTNPLTVPTTTPFSLPSFEGSAIPKYILGPYSSLVLPESPLALAYSDYGVSAVEKPHDAATQSTESYEAPAVSLDTIKNLPLSQQWGYYSAEPFQPASVEINQSDVFSGALDGGYQSPQNGLQQSGPSQQNSEFNQQPSTADKIPYPHFKQTANSASQNTLKNKIIPSTDANVGERRPHFGSDRPPKDSENVLNEDGSFSYKYETEDGIKVEVGGHQKQIGADPANTGTVAKGSYSYTAPDGAQISVNWVADENGFQPTGQHLPTPPSVPHYQSVSINGKTSGNSVPAQWGQSTHAY